MERPYPKGLEA